jgi:hypothetical protein
MDAGHMDALAAARARNPHYQECPPGVANERVERPVLYGLIDFLIYVLLIFPFALANQSFFMLWTLTTPFAFLSAAMPVGPVSAWYWSKARAQTRPRVQPNVETLEALRARRLWLQQLALESVKVEAELLKDMDKAGELRYAFEAQIRQARDTRVQIGREMAKIDAQIMTLEISRSY